MITDLIIGYIFPLELLLAVVVYMLPLPGRKGCLARFFAGVLAYVVCIRLFDQGLSLLSQQEFSEMFSTSGILQNPVAYGLHFCLSSWQRVGSYCYAVMLP